jgi:hypothetical protein
MRLKIASVLFFLLVAMFVTTAVANTSILVDVDIKPCSCPNPLNLKGKGVLSVAIYGTAGFDTTTIDPAAVRLTWSGNQVPPLRWSWEDANGDGYADLSFKFRTQEVIQTLGLDTLNDGDVIVLILTGNLKAEFGGTPIQGEDEVWIIASHFVT